ncbi:hypothetical protein OG604_29975 [Streptomyces sp. NBC_01231]|nr:hypothetical protein OG604_29975 [Streptomyces sp. NBC_01231]
MASDGGPDAGRSATRPEERKTETTLTTRIRINIPGSRPIPPVVVRKAVVETEAADDRADTETPAPGTTMSTGTVEPSAEPSPAADEKTSDWFAPVRKSGPAKGGQGSGSTNGAGLPVGSGSPGASAGSGGPAASGGAGTGSSGGTRSGGARPGGVVGSMSAPGGPRPGGTNGAGLTGATGGPVAPGHGGGTGSFDVTEALAAGPLGNGSRPAEPRRDELPYFSENGGQGGGQNGQGAQAGQPGQSALSAYDQDLSSYSGGGQNGQDSQNGQGAYGGPGGPGGFNGPNGHGGPGGPQGQGPAGPTGGPVTGDGPMVPPAGPGTDAFGGSRDFNTPESFNAADGFGGSNGFGGPGGQGGTGSPGGPSGPDGLRGPGGPGGPGAPLGPGGPGGPGGPDSFGGPNGPSGFGGPGGPGAVGGPGGPAGPGAPGTPLGAGPHAGRGPGGGPAGGPGGLSDDTAILTPQKPAPEPGGPHFGGASDNVSGHTVTSGIPVVPSDRKATFPPGAHTDGTASNTAPNPSDTGTHNVPAAAAPKNAPKKKKGRSKLGLLIGGVIVIGGVAYGAGLLMNHSDVPKGTTVLGVDIGGGTRDDAVEKLNNAFDSQVNKDLKLSVGGKTVTLKPDQAGLQFDMQTTASTAANSDYNPVSVIGSLFGNHRVVEPVMPVDEEKLHAELQDAAGGSGSASDGTIEFKSGKAVAVYGKTGKGIDVDRSTEAVKEAYRTQVETGTAPAVALPTTTRQPTVSNAEVDRMMKEFAEPAMSSLATVQTDAAHSIKFGSLSLPKILGFKAVDGKLVETYDLKALKEAYGTTFNGVQIDGASGKRDVLPQDVASALGKALRGKTTAERTVVIDTTPN